MTATEPKVEIRHVMFGNSLKAFLTAIAADLDEKSNVIVVPLGGPLAAELSETTEHQPVLIVTFNSVGEAVSNEN